MQNILFRIHLLNAVLLINYEIDSACWKEWNLFRLPGGIVGFLLLNFPLLFIFLYGLVPVSRRSFAGLIFPLILSFGGLYAFTAHLWYIKKGHDEFKQTVSLFILFSTFNRISMSGNNFSNPADFLVVAHEYKTRRLSCSS